MSQHKILGRGSYGCVISPAYKCKNKIFDTSKLVETNFDRAEVVKKEIMISKKIMKLKTDTFNPDDYYCLIKENCKVNIEKFLKENLALERGCELNRLSTYISLQGDNCGVDMFYDLNAFQSITSSFSFGGRDKFHDDSTEINYTGSDTSYNYKSILNSISVTNQVEWSSDFTKKFANNEDREFRIALQISGEFEST